MKRNQFFLVLLISTLLISCRSTNSIILDDYYFDNNSSNIYYFNSSNSCSFIFNIRDSIVFKKKFKLIGRKIIFNDKNKFNHKVNEKGLVIKKYNENGDLELTKFKKQVINLDKLKKIYWSMNVKKYNREKEFEYEEEQIITVDNKLKIKGYYINEKDTIYSKDYRYLGNYFNKFQIYGSNYSKIVLLYSDEDNLEILINNEEIKPKKHVLKMIKIKNISDEEPKINW